MYYYYHYYQNGVVMGIIHNTSPKADTVTAVTSKIRLYNFWGYNYYEKSWLQGYSYNFYNFLKCTSTKRNKKRWRRGIIKTSDVFETAYTIHKRKLILWVFITTAVLENCSKYYWKKGKGIWWYCFHIWCVTSTST